MIFVHVSGCFFGGVNISLSHLFVSFGKKTKKREAAQAVATVANGGEAPPDTLSCMAVSFSITSGTGYPAWPLQQRFSTNS